MRKREQIVWELVRGWLRKAEEDFRLAQELMERDRISYNPVGFHAQQAVEKYLKGLLTRHQIPFPKTHDIEELLTLAEKTMPGIHAELRGAEALSPYGVEIRYPDENPDLTREQGSEAVRLAELIRSAIMRRLDEYLREGQPGELA